MKPQDMSWIEHLGELRKRLLWILIVFVITIIGGLSVAGPLIDYLKSVPPAINVTWNVFSPWDAIRIYMQFAFAIGLVVCLPFILFQLWSFVKPGLRPEEQSASLKYIPFAILLFLTGMSFAYYVVFPMAFYFTTLMTERLQLTQTYGIAQYFSFMFNILIPLSLVFELPIVIMFLTKLRIINPQKLARFRRYAYVLLLIVGAVITPPDVVSAIIVTIPLIVLYEFSLILSRAVYRKQLAADRAWVADYGEK